jgi:hypothetical protein
MCARMCLDEFYKYDLGRMQYGDIPMSFLMARGSNVGCITAYLLSTFSDRIEIVLQEGYCKVSR